MDGSTIKAMKLLDERDEVIRKTRVFRDVSVEGFENCWLQRYAVKLALLKHFASCGKMLSVSVLKSLAYIRFEGEGAQDKALELDGTDMGGWTAIVKPAVRPIELNYPSSVGIKWFSVCVTAYDTGLPEIDIQIALHNHFSSCGEVTEVEVFPGDSAVITIGGERCVEKALELSGRKMGEMNLVVYSDARKTPIRKSRRLIDPNACGYMLGSLRLKLEMEKEEEEEEEKKEEEKEKEMAMEKQKQKQKIHQTSFRVQDGCYGSIV